MKWRPGRQKTLLLAYLQMRRQRAVRAGELAGPLRLTRVQERKLFRRMARGGLTARVRPGLGLVPPQLLLGGSWSPDEVLALNTLLEDRQGRYQICGPNAFNRLRSPSVFRASTALTGANDSTQYNTSLGYTSLLGRQAETIKIEVGLREPLLTPAIRGEARTLLLGPISGSRLVPAFPVPCLSREEVMAGKLRAALSRREAAIRDFFDVDYAVRRLGLRPQEPDLIGLVRAKLAVSGNEPVDVSAAPLAVLRPQVESQLKPVLRAQDFADFDLERAFRAVAGVAAALG